MSALPSPSRTRPAAKAGPVKPPPRAWADYPEGARQRAEKRMTVARVYFDAREAGKTKDEANTLSRAEWLKQFGEACSEKTIRRLEARVTKFGGVAAAPREAYCDGKSCPHVKARQPKPTATSGPADDKKSALLRAISLLAAGCEEMATVSITRAEQLRALSFDVIAAAAKSLDVWPT